MFEHVLAQENFVLTFYRDDQMSRNMYCSIIIWLGHFLDQICTGQSKKVLRKCLMSNCYFLCMWLDYVNTVKDTADCYYSNNR